MKQRPASCHELFWVFTWLALQGFGGVLVIAQRELVDKRAWLTAKEFAEDWALAQLLPGPNVVNLSLSIGARYFGWRGALAALAGMMTFPLIVLLFIAALFAQYADTLWAKNALRGMAVVAVGVVAAGVFKLLAGLRHNVLGLYYCFLVVSATFVGIAVLKLPLAWVLLTLAPLSCVIAYRRLHSGRKAHKSS